jgi:hypothetical protein
MARGRRGLALLAVLGTCSFGPFVSDAQHRLSHDNGRRAVPALTTAGSTGGDVLVRVRLVTNGHLTASQVKDLCHEVERIWAGYGVRLDWRHRRHLIDPLDPGHLAVVLVEGGSSRQLASLHPIRTSYSYDPPYDRPDAVIRVSVKRARRLAGEAFRNQLSRHISAERKLPVLLGRAVAHEIGHYLLQTREHTARGLMRPVFRSRDVLAGPRKFGLDDVQVARLLVLWGRREATRLVSSRDESAVCSVPEP